MIYRWRAYRRVYLALKDVSLYTNRGALNKAYIAIDDRTKYSEYNDYNTNDSFTTIEIAIFRAAKIDAELEEELDIILRLLLLYTKNAKAITTIVKDIPER